MSDSHRGPGLRGRRTERAALDRLLAEVRAGQSRVLVLRGEAGAGKTALLDYLQEQASGFRVARAAGVESEMELAFAGLHQLCTPMLSGLAGLPGPQRDALGTVFGLSTGEAPGRLLVGLAVLGLLSGVAEERPLVCLVDDAQWLDRPRRRRWRSLPAACWRSRSHWCSRCVSPARAAVGGPAAAAVDGLSGGDARALLDSVIPGRLDERVRDRIVAETRGNPLALLELPQGLSAAELAGGFGLPDAPPLANRIERSFLRRLRAASGQDAKAPARGGSGADRRRGLVVAGCRAARRRSGRGGSRRGRGVDRARCPGALLSSVAARRGLPGGGVPDRREVHRALAEATDPGADPDRRAWHRAHAATGPDEACRGRTGAVGRPGARPRGRRGGGRVLAAVGRVDAGSGAAWSARAGRRAGQIRGRCALMRRTSCWRRRRLGRWTSSSAPSWRGCAPRWPLPERRGSDAPPLLLDAAKRLEPLDSGLARETYLEALGAAIFAGRLGRGLSVREAAEAARCRAARRRSRPADGPAARRGRGAADRGLRRRRAAAQARLGCAPARRRPQRGWHHGLALAGVPVAPDAVGRRTWHELAARAVRLAREAARSPFFLSRSTYRGACTCTRESSAPRPG